MRKWHREGLLALALLAMAGCAEQSPSVTEAVERLRTGLALRNCREACLATWRGAQPRAAQLDAAARWPELAALVLGTGYQDDLSLYYLGRAAEGIGYPGAAASYYRQSTYITGNSSCRSASGVCGGVVLPQAALLRLAAIERGLGKIPRQRSGPAPRAPVPGEVPSNAGPLPPPEPELATSAMPRPPLPPEPAMPVPGRVGPGGFEYIEPPPASR